LRPDVLVADGTAQAAASRQATCDSHRKLTGPLEFAGNGNARFSLVDRLTGDYVWSTTDQSPTGTLRPLRQR
jgi:hypothetical protein